MQFTAADVHSDLEYLRHTDLTLHNTDLILGRPFVTG